MYVILDLHLKLSCFEACLYEYYGQYLYLQTTLALVHLNLLVYYAMSYDLITLVFTFLIQAFRCNRIRTIKKTEGLNGQRFLVQSWEHSYRQCSRKMKFANVFPLIKVKLYSQCGMRFQKWSSW